MTQWYFSVNNHESGPFSTEIAKAFVRENPGAYCWREGWSAWQPVHQVPEIRRMKKDGVTPFPAPPPEGMSPKPSALPATDRRGAQPGSQASRGFGSDQATAGIDYRIYGHEMQFVEVELDPGESAVAEAGAMMYKTAGVKMETFFGDGSGTPGGGIMERLLGAGKRLLTNESLFITVFTQDQAGKGRVAFGAPFPGTILALKLSDYGGRLICQKDSFLAAAKGVQIGIQFQRRILTGLFGGEGFIMQKLEGDGWIFVHMGGTLHKLELRAGETLHVDTGCLAALTAGVEFDVERAGGIKTMLFGGEGLFFAKLTGPGIVWLQSLPFSRLAGRMLSAAPQGGGRQRDEGSVLGGLGNLLGGD
ncbi:MAG: TIGR00266 family protein [Methylococcaceae bacterium]|nr:TIGR00266 family protein [Methylococcaceae bacterium]